MPTDCQGPIPRRLIFVLGLLALLPSLFYPAPAEARQAADEQQLKQLRTEIERIQRGLERTREERDAARDELRDREREVSALLASLKDIKDARRQEMRKQNALQGQRQQKQAQVQTQLQELGRHLRTAYAMGGQEHVKLLLNQEDPARISRVLVYHRYFTRARSERIASLQGTLADLAALEVQAEARAEALSRLAQEQAQQKQKLEQSRERQQAALAALNQRVTSQEQEIARLRKDEQRLSQLVKDIGATVAELPPLVGSNVRFRDYRGKLPLPVAATVTATFGSPKPVGGLSWKGVFLAAPAGREIRSVFPGRVAYADWLRGFGLLLILDHGEGYMTLYGHSQSLYKRVGEWVEAGETIGLVGNSGGHERPGVYFEIRQDGEPRDPLHWCRRR